MSAAAVATAPFSPTQQQTLSSPIRIAEAAPYLLSPSSTLPTQRPQLGISPVPKFAQSSWQSIAHAGSHQYLGNTFQAAMAAHLPTQLSTGHAEGPQQTERAAAEAKRSHGEGGVFNSNSGSSTLPDANHRQAWSTQPTFRWFKRSDYKQVPDRWSKREGIKGRGDNTYRPLSIQEQMVITDRVHHKKQARGDERKGEW